MIKPIAKITVGTVFDRGGDTYTLRSKSDATAQAHRESDGALVSFSLDASGDVKLVPDVCFFAELPGALAS